MEINIEGIIDEFLDSRVHIYLDDGAYVNRNFDLIFDKSEHNKLFEHGYYKPDYKEWLLENSKIRIK